MNKKEKTEEVMEDEPIEHNSACEKCDEYLTGWKRALADYDNIKKDLIREKQMLRHSLAEEFILSVLPVLDNFDQATKHKPNSEGQEIDVWLTGILHIRTQLEEVLKSIGAEPFGHPGEAFDPTVHEASGENRDQDKPDQSILEINQRGWKINDKIIRPAKVIVNNL